jgi:hypothetical protein
VSRCPSLLVAVGLMATLAACGKEEAREAGPEVVLKRYYSAGRDPAARCDTLSSRSLERFGGRANCEKRTIPSPEEPAEARVEEVRKRGETACVRFEVERGGKGIATLVNEDGEWKVDHFDSGFEPSQQAALACASEGEGEPEEEREAEGRAEEERGAEGGAEPEQEREAEREREAEHE